jgi:hypothetical protein
LIIYSTLTSQDDWFGLIFSDYVLILEMKFLSYGFNRPL